MSGRQARPAAPRLRPLVAVGALALGLLSLAGCASTGVGSGDGPAGDPPATAAQAAGAGSAAWQIPPGDLGSQRLFRVRYEGPDGEVGLRLTLWLATPASYRLSAADVLGRPVWTLAIDGEKGLWLDHRAAGFCRFTGAINLDAVPLSPFRFAALPALLLGRLPERPAKPGGGPTADGRYELQDRAGLRWTYEVAGGRLVSWTAWKKGEPAAWWSGRGEEAILSQRADATQIRWRQVVREPLGELPPRLEIPAGYLEGCAQR